MTVWLIVDFDLQFFHRQKVERLRVDQVACMDGLRACLHLPAPPLHPSSIAACGDVWQGNAMANHWKQTCIHFHDLDTAECAKVVHYCLRLKKMP